MSHLDLDGLNAKQYEAVMHSEGPLLVLAGAGSGKTRVITFRIARLLQEGVSPEEILGVTFTNKAAKEMRERLTHLVGKVARQVTLSTFHSLGLSILKEEAKVVGLRKGFCIYDTSDQLGVVRELMKFHKVADRRLDPGKILDIILKTKRLRLKAVEFDWADEYEFAASELYPKYMEQMRAFNAVDFDDLMIKSMDALRVPEVAERWSRRYRFIMVDEYQDTSTDQLDLLKVLAGHNNICVVGDDDQSIYGWRGAASENILKFEREFPGALEVILDQNYRSTNSILNVANDVITNNSKRKSKELWSESGDGAAVDIVTCSGSDDEAEFVCEKIRELRSTGAKLSDVAILYRSNLQSRIFEEFLGSERLPYEVVGGQAFYERKEVRDLIAYLSFFANPRDEMSLRRIVNVPARGIGATTIEKLTQLSDRRSIPLGKAIEESSTLEGLNARTKAGLQSFVDLTRRYRALIKGVGKPSGTLVSIVDALIEETRLRDSIMAADEAPTIVTRRLENLDEVLNGVRRFEEHYDGADLALDFVRSATLIRNEEDDEEDKGTVTLMTLHSAKGLEFPYVFMVGLEEDLLPHKKSIEEGGEISEERRLCYVGITRARQRLWMSFARQRGQRGKMVPRTPSRFLEEISDGVSYVRRWDRERPMQDENYDPDAAAANFFANMKAMLGDGAEEKPS